MIWKQQNVRNLSICIVWLFHLSAIIGVSLGYFDWFINKTPLNLIMLGILVVINFPIDTAKKRWITVLFFSTGMVAEWIGVQYGFLFGEYIYGNNLGIRVDGVPLLIGVNWAILALCTAAISSHVFKNMIFKVVFGALLMVFLDFFIEVAAPSLDFWTWTLGEAPLKNYITWFIIALFLHVVYHASKIKGDFTFSLHLYAAQLIFFVYFYGVYRL